MKMGFGEETLCTVILGKKFYVQSFFPKNIMYGNFGEETLCTVIHFGE
jgi:hypothetical protein